MQLPPQHSLRWSLLIDFVLISSDLQLHVLNAQVKMGSELSTDHHLMVRWSRWWGKLLDRLGRPKHIMRICWECLAEVPAQMIFYSHPAEFCLHPKGGWRYWVWIGHVPSPHCWVSCLTCGRKVVNACRSTNTRIQWWTPEAKEAVRLKNESFWTS